jgi:hypothetical protein
MFSPPVVPCGFTMPLQAGHLLGQLLHTSFCGAFCWFCDQDSKDQVVLAHFLLFIYFCNSCIVYSF